jgi:hypothetical protein
MARLYSLAPLTCIQLTPPLGLEVPNRRLAETVELDERLRRTLACAKHVAGE